MEQHPEVLDGETGLWDMSRRTTMMVLALKLLEDLRECGVGTNKVEAEAKKCEVQRWIKKGKCVNGTNF